MSKHREITLFFTFIAPLFHFIAYKLHFFKRKKTSIAPPIRFPLIGAICYLILIYFLFPLFSFLFSLTPTLSTSLIQGKTEILMGIFQLLSTLFLSFFTIIFFLFQPQKTARKILGTSFSFFAILKELGFGFLTYLISFPLVILVYETLKNLMIFFFNSLPKEQFAIHILSLLKENSFLFTLILISIIITVPFVEESIFRGFLQTHLKSKFGFKKAWILSSFLFASFHYHSSQGMTNLPLIVALFILSLYLGFIYEKRQSLIAPIALHMTFNSISVIRIVLSLN